MYHASKLLHLEVTSHHSVKAKVAIKMEYTLVQTVPYNNNNAIIILLVKQ